MSAQRGPGGQVSRHAGGSRVALAVVAVAAIGCQSGTPPERRAAGSATPDSPAAPTMVRGPTGGQPIAPFVAADMKRRHATGETVFVYVGAEWCEPCKRFHEALDSGRLNDALAGSRFIEFDLDADRDALDEAGYASKMIPLFALPGDDGRASRFRMEGSVKGAAAVDGNLIPRLEALRARARGR